MIKKLWCLSLSVSCAFTSGTPHKHMQHAPIYFRTARANLSLPHSLEIQYDCLGDDLSVSLLQDIMHELRASDAKPNIFFANSAYAPAQLPLTIDKPKNNPFGLTLNFRYTPKTIQFLLSAYYHHAICLKNPAGKRFFLKAYKTALRNYKRQHGTLPSSTLGACLTLAYLGSTEDGLFKALWQTHISKIQAAWNIRYSYRLQWRTEFLPLSLRELSTFGVTVSSLKDIFFDFIPQCRRSAKHVAGKIPCEVCTKVAPHLALAIQYFTNEEACHAIREYSKNTSGRIVGVSVPSDILDLLLSFAYTYQPVVSQPTLSIQDKANFLKRMNCLMDYDRTLAVALPYLLPALSSCGEMKRKRKRIDLDELPLAIRNEARTVATWREIFRKKYVASVWRKKSGDVTASERKLNGRDVLSKKQTST